MSRCAVICHPETLGRAAFGRGGSVPCQRIQRQVELQHVDMRLADDAEQRLGDMRHRPAGGPASSGRPRALATRGTWNSAPAGVMSGSRPLAEAGHQIDRHRRARVLRGQRLPRRAFTRSISAFDVGPRLEPAELSAA